MQGPGISKGNNSKKENTSVVASAGSRTRRYFTRVKVLVRVNTKTGYMVLKSGVLWGLQTSKKSQHYLMAGEICLAHKGTPGGDLIATCH